MLLLVSGGIAENKQGAEFLHGLNCARALHLLGLIQNQNWPVGGNHIDWTAGLKVVQFLVNSAGILAAGIESLHVDDHHVDAGVRAEALQIVQRL